MTRVVRWSTAVPGQDTEGRLEEGQKALSATA